MQIHDISMEIHQDMTVYKDQERYRPNIKVLNDFHTGNYYQTSIELNMHTGTHIDAPLHMLPQGATLESYSLNKLIVKCKVCDLTHLSDRITENDLTDKDIKKDDFLLFKTRNSFTDRFDHRFIFLDKGGAAYLKNKEIIGVGIDALGVERDQPDHDTHKILLSAGIIILEGLRLKEIESGEYLLCAIPLKIKGVEAAPARAVLITL